jgi:hypothetical protein
MEADMDTFEEIYRWMDRLFESFFSCCWSFKPSPKIINALKLKFQHFGIVAAC